MKSGYWVAKALVKEAPAKSPGTSYIIPNTLWKCVWKLCVTPKVQHFIWQVSVGAVATRAALFKRKCVDNPVCPICLTDEETLEHLLFLCPWAKMC